VKHFKQILKEELQHMKVEIRNSNLKKDIQCNDQKKKTMNQKTLYRKQKISNEFLLYNYKLKDWL